MYVLVLLDLSTAFDTVDHTILVSRLYDRFGIQGSAIEWIKSYLHGRKQFVMVSGSKSQEQYLSCNVPQGSVLGPGWFGDYDPPIAQIFHKYDIQYHMYADDTQVYVSFKPGVSEDEAFKRHEACLAEVRCWMAMNYLKLNEDKTDLIMFGTKQSLQNIKTNEVHIGDAL